MSPEDFIGNLVRTEDGRLRADGEAAVSYPEDGHEICHAVEERSFWFRHRNAVIQQAVAALPPPEGLPFLDVGGGNGFVAQGIQELGLRVVLVEPGEAGAARARERGIAEVVEASIVDLAVRPGSVGGIGLFDVLEHIEDDVAALQRLRAMLAPGGRIYLTVPAYRWLWTDVDVAAGHHRRYTRRSLRRALRAAGFEVERAAPFFWPLPAPMFLLRVLPDRLGRQRERAERVASEHRQEGPLLARALRWELRHRVPFGSSVVAVAISRAP